MKESDGGLRAPINISVTDLEGFWGRAYNQVVSWKAVWKTVSFKPMRVVGIG